MRFLVAIDQQCSTSIELVRDIEQMPGEAVPRHARQQHSANPKVFLCALALGDKRIGRLLSTVVQKFVGTILLEDEPGADGLPEYRVDRLPRFPVNQG